MYIFSLPSLPNIYTLKLLCFLMLIHPILFTLRVEFVFQDETLIYSDSAFFFILILSLQMTSSWSFCISRYARVFIVLLIEKEYPLEGRLSWNPNRSYKERAGLGAVNHVALGTCQRRRCESKWPTHTSESIFIQDSVQVDIDVRQMDLFFRKDDFQTK